jgi:hypothetical protein
MARSLTVISLLLQSTTHCRYRVYTKWRPLKAHLFLAIHSADQHRMIYSFANTTSYCIFYVFFSSFRITLWPMWLANSKRQPCFIHHSHTHKKTHRTDKKTYNPDGKPVLCQKTFSSVFCTVFFRQLNCAV